MNNKAAKKLRQYTKKKVIVEYRHLIETLIGASIPKRIGFAFRIIFGIKIKGSDK